MQGAEQGSAGELVPGAGGGGRCTHGGYRCCGSWGGGEWGPRPGDLGCLMGAITGLETPIEIRDVGG
jgi:hypothetical protein